MTTDFFDEVDRILEEREEKDYWEFVGALRDSARSKKDRWRCWIQEELKHLRFIAQFLSQTTAGATKDKLVIHLKRLEEIDKDNLREVVARIDAFVQSIENRQATSPEVLLSQYKAVIQPLEDMVTELLITRASLQGMTDTLNREGGSD